MNLSPYVIDKRLVRRHFERAAKTYSQAAFLQREICARLLDRLSIVKITPTDILDGGCGTGCALQVLRERYPLAHIMALDIAPAMLQALRCEHANIKNIYPLAADIEALPLQTCCMDLIFSNLALQWCNDLPKTLQGLHATLRPGGLLMFTTLGPDTLKELRYVFNELDQHTHVNAFWDMHDIGDCLIDAGFSTPVMEMEMLQLTYKDMDSLLADIKGIGASNATMGRATGLMGRRRWQHIRQAYLQHFTLENGRLPATYEVLYGHAWVSESAHLSAGHNLKHGYIPIQPIS